MREKPTTPAGIPAEDFAGGAAASVLVTKFDPRFQRTRLVDRQRLLDRLDENLLARLTLVTAPAGYGKTTLLARWREALQARGLRVGWLLLDEDDSDGPHVLRCLAIALARAGLVRCAGLGSATIFDAVSARHHLINLLNIVAEEPQDVVLILDEFEHLPQSVTEQVFLPCLDKAPPNLHLVIASRELPALKISSLRAQGLVAEIRADALRFDSTEIAALFDSEASRGELELLDQQTSGWPVALQLFRSAWADRSRRAQMLREAGTLDSTLEEYLSEQVFSGLSAELLDILVTTSVIDRISPGIVEFMTGSADAWSVILQADVLLPFLVPLDAQELEVHRMHPIIQAYFRTRLQALPWARRADAYARAARWYAASGRLVSALGCAAAARDVALAGQLIEDAGGLTLWLRSGLPRLRALIDAVDEAVFQSFPRVRLLQAFLLVKEGDTRSGKDLFQTVKDETDGFQVDREGGNAGLLKLEGRVLESTLLVNQCRTATDDYLDDYEATIRAVSRDDDIFLANTRNLLALCHNQRGDFDKSLRESLEAIDHYRQAGLIHGEFFSTLHRVTAYFALGRVGEATSHLEVARRLWREALDEERTKHSLLQALAVELEYERGETLPSLRRMAEIMAVFEHCEWWYDMFAAVAGPLVMTLLATQGIDAARRELERCRGLVRQRDASGLEPLLDAWEVSCLALSGELDKATLQLAKARPGECGEPATGEGNGVSWRQREAEAAAFARVGLRCGQQVEVVAYLEPLVGQYAVNGELRAAIRLGLLLTLAQDAAGLCEQSDHSFLRVMEHVAASGFYRALLEEGDLTRRKFLQVRPILLDAGSDLSAAARRLERLLGPGGEDDKPLLSSRECDVLLAVARGLTDKEAARVLDVSPDTIKFHLKKVYRKLGVGNRTQAVGLARAQGLIE